ncbi:MAG: hypothetical protein IPJ94_17845 [Chloroflexi bacterium]|nr:hypothetical protein [Chloroflexota bacterium]
MLGLLLNHLLTYVGSTGPDADFLRGLFARYPLKTKPISARDMPDWRGHESPTAVQEKIIGENTLRDVRLLELASTPPAPWCASSPPTAWAAAFSSAPASS